MSSTTKDIGPAHRPNRPGEIVAIALLDQQEVDNLATGFRRLYPLPADGDFDDLLSQIRETARP